MLSYKLDLTRYKIYMTRTKGSGKFLHQIDYSVYTFLNTYMSSYLTMTK